MKNNTYLNKSREHLTKGRIQKCILLLKENIKDHDLINQILQLEIRNNNLKRKLTTGTIDGEDAQLEENRISNSLVLIISNLAKGDQAFDSSNAKKIPFDFKWIIIGLLGLSVFALGIYVWSNPKEGNSNKPTTNLCEKVTCQNGGNCINGTCNCPSGYTGDRCQTKIQPNDPCKNISCLNGGICRDGNCDCPSGYTGNRCQTKVQPNDPCQNIHCLNGGICRDGTCDCPSGYSGDRCQTRLNPNEIVDARDNNKYRIKKIGSKYWTLDNIKYNVAGSKCKNCNANGRHYNLQMAKQACPSGWTLPSTNDFIELNRQGGNFQGIINLADIKFNGRYGRSSGSNAFVGVGTFAAFWTSSTQSGNGRHYFYNRKNNVNRFMSDVQGNDQMYSCKCVKRE